MDHRARAKRFCGTIAFVHKKNRELMHAMYDISFIVASAVSTCLYSNTIGIVLAAGPS